MCELSNLRPFCRLRASAAAGFEAFKLTCPERAFTPTIYPFGCCGNGCRSRGGLWLA
jgi:hypothetical protein